MEGWESKGGREDELLVPGIYYSNGGPGVVEWKRYSNPEMGEANPNSYSEWIGKAAPLHHTRSKPPKWSDEWKQAN